MRPSAAAVRASIERGDAWAIKPGRQTKGAYTTGFLSLPEQLQAAFAKVEREVLAAAREKGV